jgi:hypothetical protein
MNIQIVLPFLMIITLTLSVPINKLELKKSIVPNDGKLLSPTGKVISVAEKNLKPNKEEPTFVVSEELTFSSTGYPTFDAFDHNSDGFIEFDEFTASDGKDHKSNFQRADTNGKCSLIISRINMEKNLSMRSSFPFFIFIIKVVSFIIFDL